MSTHRASSSAGSRNDIFSARPSAGPAPPAPLPPRIRRAAPRSWLAASQHPDALPSSPPLSPPSQLLRGHTRIVSDSAAAPLATASASAAIHSARHRPAPASASYSNSHHADPLFSSPGSQHHHSLPPPSSPSKSQPHSTRPAAANSIFDAPLGVLSPSLGPPRTNTGDHVRKKSTGRRTEAQRAREHARIRHRDQTLSPQGSGTEGTLMVETDLSEMTPETDDADVDMVMCSPQSGIESGPTSPPSLTHEGGGVSMTPSRTVINTSNDSAVTTPVTPALSSAAPTFGPPSPSTSIRSKNRSVRRRRRRLQPVSYRLFPSPEYFLAEGRYCDVYLGSYIPPPPTLNNPEEQVSGEWQLCAVKRLHADTTSQLVGLDEAYALRRLGKHPGIVQLIDIVDEMPAAPLGLNNYHNSPLSAPPVPAGASPPPLPSTNETNKNNGGDPPRLLILLELLPHSLATYVSANPTAVDLNRWLDWAIQLADIMNYMHGRGAIHGDIKLDNCLCTHDLNLKLCDFNSTLWIDLNNLPTDGAGLGTPAYSAPELTNTLFEPKGFGFPVDVWAMGTVLYSLASGKAPFAKATSMVDMLHRKALFWESEESERAKRLALDQGLQELGRERLSALSSRSQTADTRAASVAGSTTTRSIASLSGTPSRTVSRAHSHRRDPSSSSYSHSTSKLYHPSLPQMTVTHGRVPKAEAVATLLAPDPPSAPLAPSVSQASQASAAPPSPLFPPGSPSLPSSPIGPGIPGRASSMRAPPGHPTVRTNRCVSGVPRTSAAANRGLAINTQLKARRSLRTPLSPLSPDGSVGSPTTPGGLLAPLLNEAPSSAAESLHPHISLWEDTGTDADAEPDPNAREDDSSMGEPLNDAPVGEPPYADGMPAMILPGGGRLPDAARDLVRSMVLVDPKLRPSAAQVVERLRALREVHWSLA